MATRKQAEAVEAVEELQEALDAAHQREPSEAMLKFQAGEITWNELVEAGG